MFDAHADTIRSLHGVVRARSRGALAGATVCQVKASGELSVPGGCVESNSEGQFSFSELASNARGLLAFCRGYRPRHEGLEQTISNPDLLIELEPKPDDAGLLGRVVDASGGPVMGALVTLLRNTDAALAVTSSDRDGRFELTADPGAVEICAAAEAYSRTCSRVRTPSDEHVLVLTPESRIVGRVRRRVDGGDIVGATVIASNRDGLRIPDRSTLTGRGGAFTIDALPAGGYELIAVSENSRSVEQWVTVGLSETSAPITLWATAAVRVSGQLLVGGSPCAFGSLNLLGPIWARGFSGLDGHIELNGIVSGHYDATIECDGAVSRTVALDVGQQPVEHVFFLEQTTNTVDDNAAPSGTIRASVDAPPQEAFAVSIESADGELRTGRRSGSEFVFEGVRSGEYMVYVDDHVEQAQPVRISGEGAVVDVRLKAPMSAWLSGQVTSEDGTPVADAWVSSWRSDLIPAPVMRPPILTGADGTFRLSAVPKVPYTLEVSSSFGDAELHDVRSGDEVLVHLLAPASLSGQIQTPQGGPVPEFTLTYYAEKSGNGKGIQGGNSRFQLSMLEPDTYTLQVTSQLGSALERVRLSPSEAATITLTLSDDSDRLSKNVPTTIGRTQRD